MSLKGSCGSGSPGTLCTVTEGVWFTSDVCQQIKLVELLKDKASTTATQKLHDKLDPQSFSKFWIIFHSKCISSFTSIQHTIRGKFQNPNYLVVLEYKFHATKGSLCKIIGQVEETKGINKPIWWENADMNMQVSEMKNSSLATDKSHHTTPACAWNIPKWNFCSICHAVETCAAMN